MKAPNKAYTNFEDKKGDFTLSHKIILLAFAIAIGVIVWGVQKRILPERRQCF